MCLNYFMNKIYYLSTCHTCKKIIKVWSPTEELILIDLKKNPINQKQLKELYELSKSYESLFNKRALLFREFKKKKPIPAESDYKKLILEHYTFLKRPILLINGKLIIGNSKKSINEGLSEINNLV